MRDRDNIGKLFHWSVCFVATAMSLLLVSICHAEPFVIGRVSDNVSKSVRVMQPIAEYVVSELRDSRFESVEVFVAKDLSSLVHEVREGKVHWVSESFYGATVLAHSAGMQPTLVRAKKGVLQYQSVILASPDIHSLSDLVGKKIAVEDRSSFTGFFLGFREILARNLPYLLTDSIRDVPSSDKVNIVFSTDEENNLNWLKFRLVDAAVLSNTDIDDPGKTDPQLIEGFNEIYRSENYPRAIELFSNRLSPELKSRIKDILLRLDADAEVMQKYDKSTQFVLFEKNHLKQMNEVQRFLETHCVPPLCN